MPDTWITDLQHFLDESGSIAVISGPARKLAEHFTGIVAELSADLADIEGFKKIPCRRKPERKPCKGIIESWIDPETGEICWTCPECGDNGYIKNWEDTLWDLSNELPRN